MFVENLTEVECNCPVELVPGHFLRRGSNDEISRIRELLQKGEDSMMATLAYETLRTEGGAHQELPQKEWKYWFIECRDTSAFTSMNGGFQAIEEASGLTDCHLRCRIMFPPAGGIMYFGHLGESALDSFDLILGRSMPLSGQIAEEIPEIHKAIVSTTAKFEEVRRSLSLFRQVSRMRVSEHLSVLGLFSVIESLLTHNPRGGEYDSLGHQIRTKMLLLDKRFASPIDYTTFDDVPAKTVWSKLYDLRSRIAHGGQLDFKNSLKVLKDLKTSTEFLKQITKRVLRHALVEPQLILDLRNC